MPRRGNPEKIYHAQRAGIFMRLVSYERLDRFDAEHWIARWEREAEATGRARGYDRLLGRGLAVDIRPKRGIGVGPGPE